MLYVGLAVIALLLGVIVRGAVIARIDTDGEAETVSASDFVTGLSTIAILVLAFIMVAAFETWTDAKQVAGEEADQVVSIARHASFLPEEAGAEIVADLGCYARSVEHLEWKAMEDRESSVVTEEWLEGLNRHVEADKGLEGAEQFIEYEAALIADRRSRLADALPAVPDGMYAFMVLTVLVTIFGLTVFTEISRRRPGHVILLLATVMILAGVLVITKDLDTPYSGSMQIDPVAIQHATEVLDEEMERYDAGKENLPCDKHGVPREGQSKAETRPII
jgi:hypothetical protein